MTAGYRRELDNVNGESVEVGTEAALYRTSKLLKESHLVREEGFEPPRACARQLLRLLRLPVPPFPPKYRIPRHTLPPIWATRRKQRQVCRYHCVPDIRGTAIADCVLPLSIANSKQVRSPHTEPPRGHCFSEACLDVLKSTKSNLIRRHALGMPPRKKAFEIESGTRSWFEQ